MIELDLKKTVDSGQIFRAYDKGNGLFEFFSADRRIVLDEKKDIRLQIAGDQYWTRYFDLDRDYEAVAAPAKIIGDDFMTAACSAGEGIRILRQDPWEMLISFIISQRKSIPAIRTSVERLCTFFGKKMDGYYSFPTPEELYKAENDRLSACGLGYRTEYVKDAAEKIYHNEIDLAACYEMDDDTLSEELKKIKGVGDKVANCIMLFAYSRFARVPVDTWVKKITEEDYNGSEPFSKYGENAGIMQQYAFYYKRMRIQKNQF